MTEKTKADQPSAETPAPDVGAEIAAARAQGFAEGVKATRARRTEIMGLDDAKGREAQAEALIETDLTVDQVKAVLAAAPDRSGETQTVADYDRTRAAGAGLARGSERQKATINPTDIYAARRVGKTV